MKRRFAIIRLCLIGLCAVAFVGCKGVPGYVIKPNDMAELLADIHTAEAVVDVRLEDYRSDSARMVLKQAVFDKHGVTAEEFDTSLIWYGHNIGKYIEVYDKTIDLLNERSARAGSMVAQEAISMAGDSVDIWAAARHLYITNRLPSKMLTFDISADENWEPGDRYTWRIKLIGVASPEVNWGVVANYADSTLEMFNMQTSQEGWNQLTFTSDSTRVMTRLRGYAQISDGTNPTLWADSIELLRKRLQPKTYGSERMRTRSHHEY